MFADIIPELSGGCCRTDRLRHRHSLLQRDEYCVLPAVFYHYKYANG